jgi:hypothetical protein
LFYAKPFTVFPEVVRQWTVHVPHHAVARDLQT